MRLLFVLFSATLFAQQIPLETYQDMRWRMIGPHRGGRTVAAQGIAGQPNVFYVGVNNGGVWKSTDYGRVWKPIFDDQATGSIGALAIAPSDPDVIYVGSGEGLQRPDLSTGDGMFKSTDGGRTWRHLGLNDAQQIGAIIVDPRDPNRVYAAVLGHPYGPNTERGVFRTTDGGVSWQRVLYKDENSGAIDLAIDPTNPRRIYAVLWAARQAPWEVNASIEGPGSGLYVSTNGGDTWSPLTRGLPEKHGRIGIAVAPSDGHRLFALVDEPTKGGLYRSDDSGESWRLVNADRRLWGRGSDFANVRVHPGNRDIVYIPNIAFHRSLDGGEHFTVIKGAPGGDDYHSIWINPRDPKILLLAGDQGAVISVNEGETWSSWYNQPTAQFYHVITDNQFPYWVYGGQQESGSVGIQSRGDDGQITFREWHPVGVEEYGYVAPDPLNPNLIYGGKVTRFDRRTGEIAEVGPRVLRDSKYRFLRTAPLLFSPIDKRVLYLGAQVLFKTVNGGQSWEVISPDLSRPSYDVPPSLGEFTPQGGEGNRRRGVIYTIAPSPKDVNVIWAGTDDGLIHRTVNGRKTWTNVTPDGVTAWSKVSLMDASHFDTATAYAAVNRIRCDDLRPHIYRTQDGGKSWTEIVKGLPDKGPVNVVREDPVRKGLLFAGTERAVYVSFNDGAEWQPLRLNMPATSIRDLVIKDDDIVVGTHGRSFWILDDITPLRQLRNTETQFFRPQTAMRIRWNKNNDTPLPREEPAGQNPPDGAILNYYLGEDAPVTIEVFRGKELIRRFSSDDKPRPPETDLQIADYWIRPDRPPGAARGMHRFVWDLRYPPPNAPRDDYPISAIVGDTPRQPRGPAVAPGAYTVKLTAGSKTFTQPLTLKLDPRIKADLSLQHTLSMRIYEKLKLKQDAELTRLLELLQSADVVPTTQIVSAVLEKLKQ